jgi:hypothetical protein
VCHNPRLPGSAQQSGTGGPTLCVDASWLQYHTGKVFRGPSRLGLVPPGNSIESPWPMASRRPPVAFVQKACAPFAAGDLRGILS